MTDLLDALINATDHIPNEPIKNRVISAIESDGRFVLREEPMSIGWQAAMDPDENSAVDAIAKVIRNYSQVGDAVARMIARQIAKHLREHPEDLGIPVMTQSQYVERSKDFEIGITHIVTPDRPVAAPLPSVEDLVRSAINYLDTSDVQETRLPYNTFIDLRGMLTTILIAVEAANGGAVGTREQDALNDAIDAWGARHHQDPDHSGSESAGWTFGWYAEQFLKDRGLVIVEIADQSGGDK